MNEKNKAAWIAQKGARISVDNAPYPALKENHVITQDAAIALNPLDWKMQDYGILVRDWPTIIGCDVAGEVVERGRNVKNISVGQRVLGQAISLITSNNAEAAFQLYTSVPSNLSSPIPDDMSFEAAAVLPLSVACAAAGPYEKAGLSLPLPSSDPPKSHHTVLVWGGSSSVGSSAIQLARASGIEVLRQLHLETSKVVDTLVGALKDSHCIGAFDTIGSNARICAEILARLGGGHIATTLEPPERLPDGVTANHVFATSIRGNEIGEAIFGGYLPRALADGSFKASPAPTIVGHGLEQLQAGINRLKGGVSAAKLVLSL